MENTALCCLRLKSLYYLKFIFYTSELCNLVLSVVTSSDTSGLFVNSIIFYSFVNQVFEYIKIKYKINKTSDLFMFTLFINASYVYVYIFIPFSILIIYRIHYFCSDFYLDLLINILAPN
jgi:hypothetical protein